VPSENTSPIVALVTSFLSAVMAALTAFNVFAFSDAQKAAVLGVAVASIALGLYVWAFLHQQNVHLKALQGPEVFLRARRLAAANRAERGNTKRRP
jgi:hypothetical protein